MSEPIELYEHAMGPERGYVELVDRRDSDVIRLICTSDNDKDLGVVFIIYLDHEDYEDLCENAELSNLEGCIIEKDAEKMRVKETPEKPVPEIPKANTKNGNVRMLITDKLYNHSWGRCCCIKHGTGLKPVTTELILKEQAPWWSSPLTPFQLDLLKFADNPDKNAMHVLTSMDHMCGNCEHFIWLVADEDIPKDLPPKAGNEQVEEPLCPERNALEAVEWESKSEAWEIFKTDPKNAKILERCGLPIARANRKQKKKSADKFKRINKLPEVQKPIHTVKQAFFLALGEEDWEGTWADLDLDIMKLIPGLKKLSIPAEILELVELSIDHNEDEYEETKEELDDEANHLRYIIDEDESTLDDDDIPEVIEPKTHKPTNQNAKQAMIEATQALQKALTVFIKTLDGE
jgi:hypothetical protein